MSYAAQLRQFRLSYHALYGCEPSPAEIALFHARHTTGCNPVAGEERTENAGTRDTVRSSFQTAET